MDDVFLPVNGDALALPVSSVEGASRRARELKPDYTSYPTDWGLACGMVLKSSAQSWVGVYAWTLQYKPQAICNYAGPGSYHGKCVRMSMAMLPRVPGLSRRHKNKCLHKLHDAGLITLLPAIGKQSSCFVLHPQRAHEIVAQLTASPVSAYRPAPEGYAHSCPAGAAYEAFLEYRSG